MGSFSAMVTIQSDGVYSSVNFLEDTVSNDPSAASQAIHQNVIYRMGTIS